MVAERAAAIDHAGEYCDASGDNQPGHLAGCGWIRSDGPDCFHVPIWNGTIIDIIDIFDAQ